MGAGFSPLDEELALPPGQLTPLLREWVVHLGSWAPFVQVPRLLALFAGLALTRETVRRQTEAAGALLVAAQDAAAAPLAPPVDPGPPTAERLQVSADGAMVRLTRGQWVEVKTVAVGVVAPRRAVDGQQDTRTRAISYFSRHAEAAAFTQQAVVELHRRGVRRAHAVAGVMDGALWLQGFLDYHRPDAVRILDLPHAAEHLGALAVGLWGEGAQAQQWQGAQVAALREGGPAGLLRELSGLTAQYGAHPALLEHGAYLRQRAAQMEYGHFRAAGWPIGSGMVESANKLVVEARLKGAGMGWAAGSVNPMLALRTAVCSDRWAEGWATIWAAQQGQERGGRPQQGERGAPQQAGGTGARWPAGGPAQRETGAAEMAGDVTAILEQVAADLAAARAHAAGVQGKPGAGHPWRRSPLGTAR